MDRRDLIERRLPDHADSKRFDASALGREIIGLENDHVAGIASSRFEKAGGAGVLTQRCDDLDEVTADGEERVAQTEGLDERVAVGDLGIEDFAEALYRGGQVIGGQRDLANLHIRLLADGPR